jgi:putative SOS response-associated peptidase YedK
MCGAFSIIHPFRDVSARFNAGYNEFYEKPRFNIRPSHPIPVILNTNPAEIVFAVWGIHPKYDKTHKLHFINARNDSLQKFTWKQMLAEQRCIIPADGFYEWQKINAPKVKVPYRFELKNKELFAFAGLWQVETTKDGLTVPHCVIITTEPNDTVGTIHDRMPAILSKEDEKRWLDVDTDIDELMKMLVPYPDKEMTIYEVSTLVNIPTNDTEEIILPTQNSA